MLCGMTSGSGSARPGAVPIPEESLTLKDASTAALGAKVSAPSHTQYLPFMKLFAMLLLIHGSLEVLVAAQICWLSFFLPGELIVICKHGQVPEGSLDSSAKMFRPQLRCSSTWKPCLSVCAVERALGLGLLFQSLPSGVEICMLIPACRS